MTSYGQYGYVGMNPTEYLDAKKQLQTYANSVNHMKSLGYADKAKEYQGLYDKLLPEVQEYEKNNPRDPNVQASFDEINELLRQDKAKHDEYAAMPEWQKKGFTSEESYNTRNERAEQARKNNEEILAQRNKSGTPDFKSVDYKENVLGETKHAIPKNGDHWYVDTEQDKSASFDDFVDGMKDFLGEFHVNASDSWDAYNKTNGYTRK